MKKTTQKRKNIHEVGSRRGQNIDEILGVNITGTSKDGLLRKIRSNLEKNHKPASPARLAAKRAGGFYIVTPNPEIIVKAQRDKDLMSALNSADISIADGVGLKLVRKNIKIIKGREFFLDLMKLANKKRWKVYLLGGRRDVAQITAQVLTRSLKGVKIIYHKGFELDFDANPVSKKERQTQADVAKEINAFKPNLLFVAFGAPKQEKWIFKNIGKLDIGGAMAVGGSFDFISGSASLPPKSFEKLGLEWLWRLITQPWRVARMINAVIIFPLYFFSKKLQERNF